MRAVNVFEFERRARERVSAMAWDYYASGANAELTLARNERAFDEVELHYRVLVDVSERDASTQVLGETRRRAGPQAAEIGVRAPALDPTRGGDGYPEDEIVEGFAGFDLELEGHRGPRLHGVALHSIDKQAGTLHPRLARAPAKGGAVG